jgi:hypothetical protein
MVDKQNIHDDDLTLESDVCKSRREFLVAAKRWSKAVVAGVMVGTILLHTGCAWGNGGGGAWRNGGGGVWGNGGGRAWRNGGSGGWRNGGSGGWRNGGGRAWRNGGGGGWRNRGRSWANRR